MGPISNYSCFLFETKVSLQANEQQKIEKLIYMHLQSIKTQENKSREHVKHQAPPEISTCLL